MGKSRAEIQKAYRERQKAKGGQFLARERQRHQTLYISTCFLSKKYLEKKRKEVRERVAQHRHKKRRENRQMKRPSFDASPENSTNVDAANPSTCQGRGQEKPSQRWILEQRRKGSEKGSEKNAEQIS
uniref:Uncharacterized protein n=1 Tax=Branchiostoma floridae TaxID=7739 RepID=C3Z0N0_BRAFL|eukprot:XP_002597898.1 hypothetical protein BRAFLDRAFT_97885 [Branchiostoma floridae]